MFRTTSRRRRSAVTLIAAAIAAGVLATAALAATAFTLKEAKHAKVVNFTTQKVSHANVVVNSKSIVVYTLTGDSRKHPECIKTTMCLHFWPPVTVKSMKSLSKAPGVRGKLSTWKRLGFTQVLLSGHPLYTFIMDTHKNVATGEGVVAFGGTWHARLAAKTN